MTNATRSPEREDRAADDPTALSPDVSSDVSSDVSAVLEEFAAIIAHEVSTPLAIIQTAASTALESWDHLPPDEQRGMLEMIHRNADLAALLLERLKLARDVEAGEVELSISEVDLTELVRESVSDLRQVILGGHPVEVTANAHPTVPADATATREIIFNLLSNAAKYSDESAAIDITIDVDGGSAVVGVRNHCDADNGCSPVPG